MQFSIRKLLLSVAAIAFTLAVVIPGIKFTAYSLVNFHYDAHDTERYLRRCPYTPRRDLLLEQLRNYSYWEDGVFMIASLEIHGNIIDVGYFCADSEKPVRFDILFDDGQAETLTPYYFESTGTLYSHFYAVVNDSTLEKNTIVAGRLKIGSKESTKAFNNGSTFN